MNKSVYLYELDSVRNSKEEIQYAQEQMFREIILNGNQVILTMNQLADSRAFLAAIENENTFEPFFELCQMGGDPNFAVWDVAYSVAIFSGKDRRISDEGRENRV